MSLELLDQDIFYQLCSDVYQLYKLKVCSKILYLRITQTFIYLEDTFSKFVENWKTNLKQLIEVLIDLDNIICFKYLYNNYQYLFLVNHIHIKTIIKQAARKGNSKIIQWIRQENKPLQLYILKQLAKFGYIEYDNENMEDLILYASKGGHFDVIKKLIEKGYEVNDYVELTKNAAKSGNFELFNWAFEKCKYIIIHKYDNYDISRDAAIGGNIEILNKLYHEGINISNGAVYGAAKYNRQNILDWIISKLGRNQSFNNYLIHGCIAGNNFNTVFMYIDDLSHVEFELAGYEKLENAIRYDNVKAMKYVINFFNQSIDLHKISLIAARMGSINILEWSHMNDYVKELNSIAKEAARYLQFNVIKWALDRGANNYNVIANSCLKLKNCEDVQLVLIEYLISKGANNYVKLALKSSSNGLEKITMYLVKNYFHAICNDVEIIAFNAIKSEMFNVIDFLLDNYIFDMSKLVPYFIKYNKFDRYKQIIYERTNNFNNSVLIALYLDDINTLKIILENYYDKCDFDEIMHSIDFSEIIYTKYYTIEFLCNNITCNFVSIIHNAIQNNNYKLFYILAKRVNKANLNIIALEYAKVCNLFVIDILIDNGADNFDEIALNALSKGDNELEILGVIKLVAKYGLQDIKKLIQQACCRKFSIIFDYLSKL